MGRALNSAVIVRAISIASSLRRCGGSSSNSTRSVVSGSASYLIVRPLWNSKSTADSRASIVVVGFFLVGVAQLFGVQGNVNLGTVSLFGATIVYLLSTRRREILASVDWGIIIFFISLFIVVQGFWDSNALQSLLLYLPALNPSDIVISLSVIILTSLILSQLLSNVPFVAVYIRAMQAAGFTGSSVKAWVALAGASTLAGGLSLLGAASNVIILEAAENRGSGFSSLEFSKIGLLVTIPNILILYLLLRIL